MFYKKYSSTNNKKLTKMKSCFRLSMFDPNLRSKDLIWFFQINLRTYLQIASNTSRYREMGEVIFSKCNAIFFARLFWGGVTARRFATANERKLLLRGPVHRKTGLGRYFFPSKKSLNIPCNCRFQIKFVNTTTTVQRFGQHFSFDKKIVSYPSSWRVEKVRRSVVAWNDWQPKKRRVKLKTLWRNQ